MRLAKLNRTMSHRNAMFRNMVSSLIEHEQIKTTLPKAKAVSRLAERVITWTKAGSENIFYRRKAESYLMNWTRVRNHLFQNLAKRYENRVGGYTRIHRLGHRADDHAPLAILELVDNARDLKRDKVIRTASRELAILELSRQTAKSGTSGQAKVPSEVWRNTVLKNEIEAKGVIEQVKKLLPALTNKNLEKVLSEQYVKAYRYCQPVSIPTKEEAQAEIALMKKQKREAFLANSSQPASSSSPPTTYESSSISKSITTSLKTQTTTKSRNVTPLSRSVGIPKPIGPYTDFLYSLRLHFHRNLATLDLSSLENRTGTRFASSKHRLNKMNGDDGIFTFNETDENHFNEKVKSFGSESTGDPSYLGKLKSMSKVSPKLRCTEGLNDTRVIGSTQPST
ncbi:hypothetical protein CROQUDRAFT_68140 [Cronartium quercuum f. sp. fusiforme G11]|uniref:Ribosomal protein L17 n=1 Tax=Cronartium quercuum f. sp. fusiforme G11 TaxID=708437 RepID=A0A9P6N842_9BASI|nr:hypothetical protein CROQUDRAFT_68140 [Cronartium quercuum f. sp. fusiforme G11]